MDKCLDADDFARLESLGDDNDLNPRLHGERVDEWYGRVMAQCSGDETSAKRQRVSIQPLPAAPTPSPVPSPSASPDSEEDPEDPEDARRRTVCQPPPPNALPAAPCLKPRSQWKHDPNRTIEIGGAQMDRHSCEDLVHAKLASGAWKLVFGESQHYRPSGAWTHHVMRFLVPANDEPIWPFFREIQLAGYTHWSRSKRAGWKPFDLPGAIPGYGKEVTDLDELEEFHEQRTWDTPVCDARGWLYRGERYDCDAYPDASAYGPHGDAGAPWFLAA